MTKIPASRTHKTVVALAICIGSLALSVALRTPEAVTANASRPLSQSLVEKIIDRTRFPNEPFQFGDLSVRKVEIVTGKKFSARTLD